MHAQFAAVELSTGPAIAVFVLISLALLVIGFLVWTRGKFETNLILLGLVVAVAAVGYGSLVSGEAAGVAAAGLAGTLMRLGVILVLGGIATGLLARLNEAPPADGRNL